MIKLYRNGKEHKFEITKFPDGTSQLWKASIPKERTGYFKIDWLWENNEAELFHLLQLVDLIRASVNEPYLYLNIPYLPYARQDKEIGNNTTFSLWTFAQILNSANFNIVTSFDVHSKKAEKLIAKFQNLTPEEFHGYTYIKSESNIVFYPDFGAYTRYAFKEELSLFGQKTRNQQTGTIEDYRIMNVNVLPPITGKNVFIIDDICDGGATFILAAKELMKYNPSKISLCVSHGIFSKGLDEMKEAGISEFYTTNSLAKNKEGYNVYENFTSAF